MFFAILLVVIAAALHLVLGLPIGLAVILVFIGVKMLVEFVHIEISTTTSLLVIGAVLTTSVLMSVLIKDGASHRKSED